MQIAYIGPGSRAQGPAPTTKTDSQLKTTALTMSLEPRHVREDAAAPGATNNDVGEDVYEYAQFKMRMSKFRLLFERAILDDAQYVRHKDSAY
ncbi:hypothetical protein DL770_010801 [Monosporascus sp. CRB-9-2]|nr:hypothetical protein DL770_010801 [Monosporascus sp. CRB-9-2]